MKFSIDLVGAIEESEKLEKLSRSKIDRLHRTRWERMVIECEKASQAATRFAAIHLALKKNGGAK